MLYNYNFVLVSSDRSAITRDTLYSSLLNM